jgi:hypothetical protein
MDGSEGQEGGEYELQTVVHRKKRSRNGICILIDKSFKNGVVTIRK